MALASIMILTGAGVSAESGVPTFRGPNGLWEGERVEDVATPEAFRRDPGRVQRFYDARRQAAARVEPNAAHRALARLDDRWSGELLLVSQNVDGLHARAGSRRMVEMHGALRRSLCLACGARMPAPVRLAHGSTCAVCAGRDRLRPDIVWFGEMNQHMEAIGAALDRADLFVAIGTSGQVWPAAGFVEEARMAGARTLELNLEPSAMSPAFHESRFGPAGALVPAWVDMVLQSTEASMASISSSDRPK